MSAVSCVRVHCRVLRAAGFLRARPPRPTHTARQALALAATTLYLVQELAYSYQERGDLAEVARVMFLLLCHVTTVAKQLALVLDADRVDQLLRMLEEPVFSVDNAAHRLRLERAAATAGRLARLFAGTAALTCTLWLVSPLVARAQHAPTRAPLWVPFDTDTALGFTVILLYSYGVVSLAGIANTTMDAFIATILYQGKTQLSILRDKLEVLPEAAAAEAVRGSAGGGAGGGGWEGGERVLMRRFVECLHHYDKVVEMTTLLQDIFGTAITIQFGIGGWILCMAAYQIVSLNVLSVQFASMILFVSCILTELLLYCFYGNEVSVESALLLDSLYGMQWQACSLRFQRALLVAMTRARRPLRPVAARVVPLSLETFVTIIKSSYSCFAVLRQTK